MALPLEYPKGITELSNKADSTNDSVSLVHFTIYDRPNSQASVPHREIALYMPETMENPSSVSWDTQAMGRGGASGEIFNGGALIDNLKHGWDSAISGMGSKASGGSQASGEDIVAFKQQAMKNPYLKMLFRGVNFRNFEFVFKFTPHNLKESDTIFEIIQELRAASLPEGKNNFKWKYPREVAIKYKYQGRDHPWLNKFKRCVITNLNVNYTSAGYYASMRNGFPAETEVRIQFSEIELVTREDISIKNGPSY